MRSDDDDGLTDEELLLGLFCALDTLSLALTRGVVVPMPLLDGLVELEGLALLEGLEEPDGLAELEGLSCVLVGTIPAEEGRLLLL